MKPNNTPNPLNYIRRNAPPYANSNRGLLLFAAFIFITVAGTFAAVRADEKHHQKSEAVLAAAWCDEAGARRNTDCPTERGWTAYLTIMR